MDIPWCDNPQPGDCVAQDFSTAGGGEPWVIEPPEGQGMVLTISLSRFT